jgi:phytoene synthase
VDAICRTRGRRFWIPTFFLRAEQREAMRAMIAFFAIAGEAIDNAAQKGGEGCSSDAGKVCGLLRERIGSLYDEHVDFGPVEERDPYLHVLEAFATTIRRFEIPQQLLLDWLEGRQRDLQTLRYATWNALQRHFHAVQGSMALAATCILGVTRSDAREMVMDLAAAAGLNDGIVNVQFDAMRGRVYLPLEDLTHFGYSERELLEDVQSDAREQLLQFEIQRAKELHARGEALIPWLGSAPARVAASIAVAGIVEMDRQSAARRLLHALRLMRQRAEMPAGSPDSPSSASR